MKFQDYWQTYFPDLIAMLSEPRRPHILAILASGFVDGDHPGRELTQRLIERDLGIISDEQFASWSLRDAMSDGSARIVDLLSEGKYVGGSRESMLQYLSHIEYTDSFSRLIQATGDVGLLTEEEVSTVLCTSLRNRPLPAIIERPLHVRDLPFDLYRSAGDPCECVMAVPGGRSWRGTAQQ